MPNIIASQDYKQTLAHFLEIVLNFNLRTQVELQKYQEEFEVCGGEERDRLKLLGAIQNFTARYYNSMDDFKVMYMATRDYEDEEDDEGDEV